MSARGILETNDSTFDVTAVAPVASVKGEFVMLANTPALNVTVGLNMVGDHAIGESRRYVVRFYNLEVDAVAGTWIPGQYVYINTAAPNDPVVATAPVASKLIGRVVRGEILPATGKLRIEFDGRNTEVIP